MKINDENGKKIAWTVRSLYIAIQETGGSCNSVRLETMTVMDFILQIAAPNDIRFQWLSPDDADPK